MSRLPKLVPSPNNPNSNNTLPSSVSFNCPIVIRDGIACGLIIISGRRPSFVNGMSHSGIILPTVPFCPCLELNLSPNTGFLNTRTRTFAKL